MSWMIILVDSSFLGVGSICLGLGGIDFNLSLFEIRRKSHKVTLQYGANYIRVPIGHEYQSVVGKSGGFTSVALLWGEYAVKKLYKERDRVAP
jgi:hypothetical protein